MSIYAHEINAEQKLLDDVKDHASALWQDVYEHPQKAVAAAGTVVLGAAILYAERDQLAKLLPAASKEVLLVEDTPFIGRAMKNSLEENGEKVTWITGVKRPSPLTGTTIDGKELIIDAKRFKVAIVDGQLEGSYMQGEHVVHALKQGGLKSIGSSTVPAINDVMLANGAQVAAPKATILSALVNDQLDLARAVRSPGQAQIDLNALTDSMRGAGGKAIRQKADNYLSRFLATE